MEIVAGLIGFALGSVITILAKYRRGDIEAEKAAKDVDEEHERELRLAYVQGYVARFRKEKETKTE